MLTYFVYFWFSLAPDYLLCSKKTETRLVPEVVKAWQSFYTDNPMNSDSYCRIVNEQHFQRIKALIDISKVIYGGETDPAQNYIAPTIMCEEKMILMFLLICIYLFLLLGQM